MDLGRKGEGSRERDNIDAKWQRTVTHITRKVIPCNGDARDGITKDEGYICSLSSFVTDSRCFVR